MKNNLYFLAVFLFAFIHPCFSQNIDVITRAAESGDVDAQEYLGKLYAEGSSTVKKNLTLAYKWYLAAAQQGNAESQYQLSTNKFVPAFLTEAEAKRWKEMAAMNGHWLAAWIVGQDYLSNNDPKAFTFLSKVNSPIAYIELAQCYLKGVGTTRNIDKAKEYLNKAIEANKGIDNEYAHVPIAEANRLLAVVSLFYEKNPQQAILYAKESGHYGFLDSYVLAGDIYQSIGDDSNAYKEYELAAKKDNLKALVNMALLHEYGKGVKMDYDKSISLYSRALAVNSSHMPAVYGIGWIYYKKGEYVKAKSYFKKAAENDEPEGYNGLAYLVANGFGEPKDIKLAIELIGKALSLVDSEDKQERGRYLDSKGEFLLMAGDVEEAKIVWIAMRALGYNEETEFTTKIQQILQNNIDSDIPKNVIANNNSFAVIIGNEKYQRVSQVSYANNDARIFAEYCRKTLGLPEKNVRVYEDATYGTMIGAISDLKKIARAFKGDINVIFYYAGHGIPNETTKESYLLPIDADGMNTEVCYPLTRLYKELGELEAKKVTVFMDACFSGAERGDGMVVAARGVAIKPKNDQPMGNTIVFSAATGQQAAYPYKGKGHGMFTYYLLKKLQETKGDVTLGELGQYICDEAAKQAILTNGKEQTPVVLTPMGMNDEWKNWKLR